MTYTPSLDGIRGLAVLMVLLYHARVPGFMGGVIGVDLFFVLSGYLITSLLISEFTSAGKINLARFYTKRALRILPALVSFIAVGLILIAVFQPHTLPAQSLNAFYILTFSYNWVIAYTLQSDVTNFTLHCWSLAVEMQYYLLWPLVLIFFLKGKRGALTYALVGMIAFSLALRIYWAFAGAPIDRIYFASDTRLDGLLLGSLLANVMSSSSTKPYINPRTLVLSLIGWIMLVSYDGYYDILSQISDPLLAGVFAFVLIAFVVTHPRSLLARIFSSRWLVWLGKISYGLYIWHYPFFKIFRENLPWPQTLALGSACSLACACLSYYLIEMPFLVRKKKLAA